jgi:hypothetical protein
MRTEQPTFSSCLRRMMRSKCLGLKLTLRAFAWSSTLGVGFFTVALCFFITGWGVTDLEEHSNRYLKIVYDY